MFVGQEFVLAGVVVSAVELLVGLPAFAPAFHENPELIPIKVFNESVATTAVSYTHLTLPTTPYV